jgi:hypothetical protein
MKLRKSERAAWALHAHAVELEHYASRRISSDDQEAFDRHLEIVMQASLRARMALVREFGNNLDTLYDAARGRWVELFAECEAAYEKRKADQKIVDKFLSEVAGKKSEGGS